MTEYSIGVDIGTQSIRAAMIDFKGNVLAAVSRSSEDMHVPRPGWAIQDPQKWWDTTCENIKELFRKTGVSPSAVLAVGVSAHMHGAVPVGADGNSLTHEAQLYCDKRAASFAESYAARYNNFDLTANSPTSNWHGFKIKWLKDNEAELYKKTKVFLTPKDFINFMLSGEACIDPSEGIGTYLINRNTLQWDDALISAMGIDKEVLPRIAGSVEVIGTVTQKASASTGLAAGTRVVGGGGDMFCSLLAGGMTECGTVSDVTGTGSIICYYNKAPLMDKRVMNLPHVIDGWVAFGCIDNSGGAYKWLKNTLAGAESAEAEKSGLSSYEYLNRLASEEPYGNNGLFFFPYLMGERTLGTPYARGMFIGMTAGTTIGAMTRAVLEGVAFEHKRTLDIFEQAGKVSSVVHTGGGARGDLWSQIKADIYQKPIVTLKNSEGGVIGSGVLAATGAGAFSSAVEGAKLFTVIDKEFKPDPAKAPRYEFLYNQYKVIHDRMQDVFDNLAKMP
jgi:xylulokinase